MSRKSGSLLVSRDLKLDIRIAISDLGEDPHGLTVSGFENTCAGHGALLPVNLELPAGSIRAYTCLEQP